jgi:predicted peptidase
MPRTILACLLAAALLTGCGSTPDITRQQVLTHQRSATQWITMKMQYLLYTPPGYDTPANANKKWPAVVMLHGVMENGKDIGKILKYGPARQIEEGKDFPFVVISPQSKDTIWHTELLAATIADAIETHRIDPDRVYLTGLSSGGLQTWVLATNQPTMFAAIAPVSSWGYPDEVHRIAHIPVWAFQGGGDMITPVKAVQPLIDAHRAAGGESKLTVLEGTGHEAWDAVYSDDKLWNWFLTHQRQPPK